MTRKNIIVNYICILSLLIAYSCGLYSQSLEYIFEPKRETDWTGYIANNSLGYYHNGPNIKFGRESSILNNRYRGWAVFDLNPFYSQFPTDNIIITNVDLIIYLNTKGNNSTYLEIKGLRSFDPKSGSNISIYDAVGNSITYKTDLSYLFPVGEGEREIGALGSVANLDFQNALQNHLNEFHVGLKAQDEESYDTDVELDGYNHTYLLENDPMPKLKVTWEYKNITVYTPNNSSLWQVGTTQNITWEDNISENVKIELFQGSTLVFPIATSTASDGNHPWPIPTSLSNGSYKIKITSISDNSLYSYSEPFTIYEPCPDLYEPNNTIETASAGAFSALGSYNYSKTISATLHSSIDVDVYTLNVTTIGSITINLPNPPADYDLQLRNASGNILQSSITSGSESITYTFSASGYYFIGVFSHLREYSCINYSLGIQWTPTTSPSPAIRVTSPNGGESWQIGSRQFITWTSNGTSGNVAILYSINNGSTWIGLTTTPDDGTFEWERIPDNPSQNCLVRIRDVDGTPSDQSDNVFTITAINHPPNKPQLLTPGNGTSWSSAFDLSWQCTDPDPGDVLNYTLRIRRKETTSWTSESLGTQPSYTLSGWTDANLGTYEWYVIANDGEAQTASDIWEFILIAENHSPNNPQLLTPENGTSWSTPFNLTWQCTDPDPGDVLNYTLRIRRKETTSWTSESLGTQTSYTLSGWTDANLGIYEWYVIANDGEAQTASDIWEFILIAENHSPNKPQLLTPENGTSWSTPFNLTWQCTDPDPGDVLNYTLRIRRKETTSWTSESLGTQTSYTVSDWSASELGTYEWSVVASDGELQSVSDIWEFTLANATINVTAPNGGENWLVGSTRNITWTSSGTSGSVRIEYSTNNGSVWTDIVASTPDDGSHSWTVPNTPSTNCLVRISDTDGSSFGQSSLFTIQLCISPMIIMKWNDVLICNNVDSLIISYQWYKGSDPIPGANNQYYLTSKVPGDYWVKTIDRNGCIAMSNEIRIAATKSLSIYPNPANKYFTITLRDESFGKTQMRLFSMNGSEVLVMASEKSGYEFVQKVPSEALDEGLYIIQILVGDSDLYISKIVVVKYK